MVSPELWQICKYHSKLSIELQINLAKDDFQSIVDREIARAVQAGITRGQCPGGFVVAQSTGRFVFKKATRRGR